MHDRLVKLLPLAGQSVFYTGRDFAVCLSLKNPTLLQLLKAAGKRLAANALQRISKLLVPDRFGSAAKRYEDFKCPSFRYYLAKPGGFSHKRGSVITGKVTVLNDRYLGFHRYTNCKFCNLTT